MMWTPMKRFAAILAAALGWVWAGACLLRVPDNAWMVGPVWTTGLVLMALTIASFVEMVVEIAE